MAPLKEVKITYFKHIPVHITIGCGNTVPILIISILIAVLFHTTCTFTTLCKTHHPGNSIHQRNSSHFLKILKNAQTTNPHTHTTTPTTHELKSEEKPLTLIINKQHKP